MNSCGKRLLCDFSINIPNIFKNRVICRTFEHIVVCDFQSSLLFSCTRLLCFRFRINWLSFEFFICFVTNSINKMYSTLKMHSYQIFSARDSRKYNHGCYRSSFIIFYWLVSNKKYLTIFSFEMIISHLNESKVKKLPHIRWKSTVISPLFHLWRFSPLNCQSVFFNSFFF